MSETVLASLENRESGGGNAAGGQTRPVQVPGFSCPTEIQNREYQAVAIAKLRLKARNRPILVSPTGSGKTVMASIIIQGAMLKQKHVLFLAHRKELIDQCSAKLDSFGVPHGIIMAGRKPTQALVQVASIQSLIRRELPKADLIICDEAHHCTAESYIRISKAYPDACFIGLTATPFRSDGKGLGHLFGDYVVAATLAELIFLGFIVPCRYFAPSKPNMVGVGKIKGDFEVEASHQRVSGLVGDVVSHYQKLARDRLAICFAVNVQHSKELRDRFIAAGITAEHLDANTPPAERDRIITGYKSGKIRVVVNVWILGEGFDCPETGAVIMAAPTASLGRFAQEIGRGLRPFGGKTDCLVLDHAGNVDRHGFLPDEFEVDLTHGTKNKKAIPSLKTCEKCYAVYPSKLQKCPECGYEKPLTKQEMKELAGELEEVVTPKKLPDPKKFYQRMAEIGKERGYKPTYALAVFKNKFGRWPSNAERSTDTI